MKTTGSWLRMQHPHTRLANPVHLILCERLCAVCIAAWLTMADMYMLQLAQTIQQRVLAAAGALTRCATDTTCPTTADVLAPSAQ